MVQIFYLFCFFKQTLIKKLKWPLLRHLGRRGVIESEHLIGWRAGLEHARSYDAVYGKSHEAADFLLANRGCSSGTSKGIYLTQGGGLILVISVHVKYEYY